MKNFIPSSPTRLILKFLLWIVLIISIVFIILYFDYNPILFSFGLIAFILEFVFEIIKFIKTKISLTSEYITTPNSFSLNTSKVQVYEKIYFKEIKNIRIISSRHDSLGKPLQTGTLYSNTYKKYLEFTLHNNTKKRILIDHYTKKQILTILDYLSKYLLIDVNEIMKNWYVTYKEMKSNSNILD